MMKEALNFIQAQFPGPSTFQKVRSDKGGEFESQEYRDLLSNYGAEPEYAETAAHKHNGAAERVIRTIEDRLRALTFESGFRACLWGQLIDTATYIYNRLSHSSIGFETPIEKFYSKPPRVDQLRIIGSKTYVYQNKVSRGHKCEPRSEIQYLIAYTPTGYKTFDPTTGKTTENCIVKIDENIQYKDEFGSNLKACTFGFPSKNNNDSVSREDSKNSSSVGGGDKPITSPEGGGAFATPPKSKRKMKNKISKDHPSVTPNIKRKTRGKRINYKDLIRSNLTNIELIETPK